MPNPLHPAVVHFPLVLAVLFPFVAAVALWAYRRPEVGRAAWIGLAAMALLLAGSAWFSIETGQRQEETVESVVAESVINGHEEAAEGFLVASIVLTAVILLGLAPGRAGTWARYLTVPGGVLVLALAFRVGGSGGALVYEHGAASAYVARADAVPTPSREREGDDDHQR